MPVTHQFVSAVADGTTLTEVRSTHWNAKHWSTITNSTAAFPEILQRSTIVGPTSNSSAAVIWSSYVVPARALGANRILHSVCWGHITVGTTAVTNNLKLEVIYNTSRWADFATTVAAAQTPAIWRLDVWVYHPTGTSGTLAIAGYYGQSSGQAPTLGLGDIGQAGAGRYVSQGILASSNLSSGFTVTTGAASSFVIQANWTAANTSLSVIKLGGFIELL